MDSACGPRRTGLTTLQAAERYILVRLKSAKRGPRQLALDRQNAHIQATSATPSAAAARAEGNRMRCKLCFVAAALWATISVNCIAAPSIETRGRAFGEADAGRAHGPGITAPVNTMSRSSMSFIRFAASSLFTLLVAACAVAPSDSGEAVRRALAPTGKLRVGLLSVPVHAIRDPYSGELKGVSHDLGSELAARLGVPFEPIMYPNPTAYLAAGQAGGWDIGSVGVAPERQALFDFAQPHLEVDYGYLVSPETPIASLSEVDRPGVRVALVARSASDLALTKDLKHASVVRGRDLSALIELVMMGEADVIAAQKTNLYNIAPRVPGSRVLDGRPGSEEQALAIPKGRDAIGLAYVRGFIQDAKNRGMVQRAIDRAGIRGVLVPP